MPILQKLEATWPKRPANSNSRSRSTAADTIKELREKECLWVTWGFRAAADNQRLQCAILFDG